MCGTTSMWVRVGVGVRLGHERVLRPGLTGVPLASLDSTLERPTRTYPDLPRRFVTNDSQSVEEI